MWRTKLLKLSGKHLLNIYYFLDYKLLLFYEFFNLGGGTYIQVCFSVPLLWSIMFYRPLLIYYMNMKTYINQVIAEY